MAAPETARALSTRLDAPAGAAHERRLPVEEALEALLPEGSIRRGTAIAVGGHGSVTLAVALAAETSRRGSWVAAVGMADLGVSALAERGIDLQRWALVDFPPPAAGRAGPDRNAAADVLGSVVGGFDVVLLGPAVRVGATTARRLLARMREHGTSLIRALGADEADDAVTVLQPEVRMAIGQPRWTGVDGGHGRLLARRAEVTVDGRGEASRPRRIAMWLPSAGGDVVSDEHRGGAAVDDGRDDVRHSDTDLRLAHGELAAIDDGRDDVRHRRAG